MKILFLTDRYPPYYEGNYELRCQEIAEGLEALGHEIVVLTTKFGVAEAEVNETTHRVLECCWSTEKKTRSGYISKKISQIVKSRHNYRRTQKLIERISPDIVFVWQLYDATLMPLMAAVKRRLPYLFQVSDGFLLELRNYYATKHGYLKRLWRFMQTGIWDLNRIDFANMIFVSEALKQKHEDSGLVNQNSVVIPCAVGFRKEGGKIPRIKKGFKEIRLLYAGRLDRTKGVHVAIQAVVSLRRKQKGKTFILDIIGDGDRSYIDELHKMIVTNHLRPYVQFYGKAPREELLEKYRDYYALLVPSLWEEPFGVVILEAMKNNLPVIASDVGGIPSIIRNRVSGILVPPNDHDALASSVVELVNNRNLYRKIQNEGAQRLKNAYNPEIILEKMNEYLQESYTRMRGNI